MFGCVADNKCCHVFTLTWQAYWLHPGENLPNTHDLITIVFLPFVLPSKMVFHAKHSFLVPTANNGVVFSWANRQAAKGFVYIRTAPSLRVLRRGLKSRRVIRNSNLASKAYLGWSWPFEVCVDCSEACCAWWDSWTHAKASQISWLFLLCHQSKCQHSEKDRCPWVLRENNPDLRRPPSLQERL